MSNMGESWEVKVGVLQVSQDDLFVGKNHNVYYYDLVKRK